MPEQHRHLPNKYEDIVNLQGAEPYRGGRPPTACLTTLHSCDDCQRRVPISCVRRQASDPWLILITVGESGNGSLPDPLQPDIGLSLM